MQQWLDMKQIVESKMYPLTKNQMKSLIVNKEKNGLNKILRKLGRRFVVKTEDFEKWLESQKI